ncbi:hypothetical protein E4U19_000077 [Claviceps sp. Clav32 group G5]|nr:hypothetical protein E4U19_000077 [Claviceps sp. Clav32 group G5]
MVRTSLVASLLAASASSLAAKSVVPGAYIFELENGQDVSAFEQTMTGDGKARMKLEYDLFSVSLVFQFNYTTSKRPSRQWQNMLRCLRSKCDKAQNAIAKGAKYVLFYNNAPGVAFEVEFDAPAPGAISAASMVDAETGETFIKALKGGKKLTFKMVGPKNAELIIKDPDCEQHHDAFSSWGPTFEMRSKPQYGAIGGTVLSTFPRTKGSYAVLSGTSMACPQAAGIIALIRQVRGAITPQEIEALLSSNSNPQLFNDGTKFYDYLAPVSQQGVTDRRPATYKITHMPAITMYSLAKDSIYVQPFPNEAVHAAATLQFSETSITLRGGQTKTIKVSAIPPEGLDAKRLALRSG